MSLKGQLYTVAYYLKVFQDLMEEIEGDLEGITYEPLRAVLNSTINGYHVSIITYQCEHEKPCGLEMSDTVGGLLNISADLVEVGDMLVPEADLEADCTPEEFYVLNELSDLLKGGETDAGTEEPRPSEG